MSSTLRRTLLRWVHLVLSIPILGYIYGEPSAVRQYAGPVRFVFFPAIVLSGLWLWKGHAVRRLLSRRSA